MYLRADAAGALHPALVEGGTPVHHRAVGAHVALQGIGLILVEAQHAVHGQRVYYLVQVEQAVGVPALLYLAHQFIGLLTVLQADELTAQTTVAVLAADAAAVLLHQQGGLGGDVAEQFAAFARLQVHDGAQVQFARADVAVEHAVGMQTLQHLAKLAQIGGQTPWGHGGVFNHTHGLGVALHAAQNAQTGLAQRPHTAHVGAVDAGAQIHQSALLEVPLQGVGLAVELLTAVGTQFADEQGGGVALHEEAVLLLLGIALAQLQHIAVHQFYGGGVVLQRHKVGLETLLQGIAVGAHYHQLLGRQRVQAHLHLGDEGQGALAAGDEAAQVDAALGHRGIGG